MKFAHLEIHTNRILGWYDDLIHLNIPNPNIEASLEVWQEAVSINANCYENGNFICKDFRSKEQIEQDSIVEKIYEAKKYLEKTDFYYARKLETGEEVPLEVVENRVKYRQFIRDNE